MSTPSLSGSRAGTGAHDEPAPAARCCRRHERPCAARGRGADGGREWRREGRQLLLLLYAADLAFRLRWEIEPELAEGRTVVAAPYVDTAMAFGRSCGLPAKWLSNLFRFARKPSERHVIRAAPAARPRGTAGFIEFGCTQLEWLDGPALAARTRRRLGAGHASRLRRRLRAR
jgi:hypothetical protein